MSWVFGSIATSVSRATATSRRPSLPWSANLPADSLRFNWGERLRLDPRSFLWQFHQHPSLQREKCQGLYVYFAADPALAARQKALRSVARAPVGLPTAQESIAVLVQAMQHPEHTPEQLAAALHSAYPHLSAPAIVALFEHHRLMLKKTPPSVGSNA